MTPSTRTIHVLSLGLAALATPAGAQSAPFNAARLLPRADSFVVIVRGSPAGFMTEQLIRDGDVFRLRNATQIGQMMSQSTDVTLSPSLALIGVKQTGQAGPSGARMSIDVSVANGRATGNATTPGPGGMKAVTVDVALAEGAVDDNTLQFLLSTIELTQGAKYEFDLFSSGQGSVRRASLVVGSAASVTVPGGTFNAYPVRLEGGPATVTMFVATSPIQRVVKVAVEGSPLDFQLVK